MLGNVRSRRHHAQESLLRETCQGVRTWHRWGHDGASLFCFDVRSGVFEPSGRIKACGCVSFSAGVCLPSRARRFLQNWNQVGPVSPVLSGLWLQSGCVWLGFNKGNCFQSSVPDVSVLLRSDLHAHIQMRGSHSLMGAAKKRTYFALEPFDRLVLRPKHRTFD